MISLGANAHILSAFGPTHSRTPKTSSVAEYARPDRVGKMGDERCGRLGRQLEMLAEETVDRQPGTITAVLAMNKELQ